MQTTNPQTRPIRRVGVFVDGENHAIRLKDIKKVVGERFSLPQGVEIEDVAHWSTAYRSAIAPIPESKNHILRIHYYTSCQGDEDHLLSVRAQLQEVGIGETAVFRKPSKSRPSKGVDIKLATDLLSSAFSNHFDDVVLVALDRDYLPLVKKVKDLGLRVYLAFPGFDLLESPWLEGRVKDLEKAMSISKGTSEYLLAFDSILRKVRWFSFIALSETELRGIAERHIKGPWLDFSRTGVGASFQEDRLELVVEGKPMVTLSTSGQVTVDLSHSVIMPRPGTKAIPVAPVATLEERFRDLLSEFTAR